MAAKRTHYVDNTKFHEAFKVYLPIVKPLREAYEKQVAQLIKKGVSKKEIPRFQRPQTPEYDYIGECLLKIAEHLSYKANYIRYTFREEMVGDAIENAILYLENFNPELYSNPFAYFTQIMTFAFYRRIESEEKQDYIKQKSLENSNDYFSKQISDGGSYENTYIDFIRDVKVDVISNFEEKKRAKKKTNKNKSPDAINKFLVLVDEEESICQ